MFWYYAKGDQRFGPLEEAELRRLIAVGGIQRGDLVWREGLPGWLQAGDLETYFPPVRPPMPPSAAPYQPEPVLAPPPVPMATEYAGLGARFGAYLLDALIFVGIYCACCFVLGFVEGVTGIRWSDEDLGVFAFLASAVITWPYYTLFESSARMATPGKRALGLRVTDLQGCRISFGRATGRYFGKFLSGIALGFGYWTIPSSPMRQGWHDQLAGCLVLRTRR